MQKCIKTECQDSYPSTHIHNLFRIVSPKEEFGVNSLLQIEMFYLHLYSYSDIQLAQHALLISHHLQLPLIMTHDQGWIFRRSGLRATTAENR